MKSPHHRHQEEEEGRVGRNDVYCVQLASGCLTTKNKIWEKENDTSGESHCRSRHKTSPEPTDFKKDSKCVESKVPDTMSSPPKKNSPLKKQHSIASQWTVEIINLRNCGSAFEIVSSIREIEKLLLDIDRLDRIKYCKSDFEQALRHLRDMNIVITDTLTELIVVILKRYFNEARYWILPDIILQEIFMMLPIDEIGRMSSVCKAWYKLCTADVVWKTLYDNSFLRSNPGSSPHNSAYIPYYQLYRHRLECPMEGDSVEVAWRGKFRLEAQDVYQGLAWWVAKVVETKAPRYKIQYPGWETRWDEWVDRRRLRWGMDKDTTSTIVANDKIELWCCGFNVPGAWLESTVRRVKRDKYLVLRTQSAGSVWVDRDRIRPRRKKPSMETSVTLSHPPPIPRVIYRHSFVSILRQFIPLFKPACLVGCVE